MTTATKARASDLAQWLRLREIREESARQQREAARRSRDDALALREVHRAELQHSQQLHRDLTQWVVGAGAASMAQLQVYASARNDVLLGTIERAEYALIDDDSSVDSAEREWALAQADWLRAQGKTGASQRLLERTRRDARQMAERRAEREIESAPRSLEGDRA